MQLFYDKNIQNGEYYDISKDESHHITRVLRKKVDDEIFITNGSGQAFKTKIITTSSKSCRVEILESYQDNPLPYNLHVGIAPPKSSDRFEFFLEKATELGITEITPLLCANSERKRINLNRSYKIIQSAMKQSQRFYLPFINDMIPFDDFVHKDFQKAQKLIAHCENQEKIDLQSQLEKSERFCILIGPEGDFNQNEIDLATSHDFLPVSLGPKRLRTETAGLYICQALALKHHS